MVVVALDDEHVALAVVADADEERVRLALARGDIDECVETVAHAVTDPCDD